MYNTEVSDGRIAAAGIGLRELLFFADSFGANT